MEVNVFNLQGMGAQKSKTATIGVIEFPLVNMNWKKYSPGGKISYIWSKMLSPWRGLLCAICRLARFICLKYKPGYHFFYLSLSCPFLFLLSLFW